MRRIRILPLLVLVLALLAGLALAEEPQVPPPSGTAQQQNLFQAFFDLSRWLQGISRDMTRLAGGISGLALALVMLGFVYGIVQGIVGGGLEAIKGAFVRLAVVGLLLSLWNSGFVGGTLDRAMTAAREWGTDASAATLSEAADNLDALALRVVPFMGAVGALKVMAARTAENAAKNAAARTLASGTSAGAARALQYLNWATLLLIPMMLFFFVIIVVASFTVEVGVALFPLAAALLIFPKGAAADWFGRWVAAVMGALLIVILLPVGFKAAVDLGVNRPVYQVNAYVDQALDRIEAQKDAGLAAMEGAMDKCGFGDVGCVLGNNLNALWTQVTAVLQQIGTALQAWLLGVILMLSGMAAAAYILFNVERVAMSFIGGFVATSVRQVMGTASLGGRIYSGTPAARASVEGAAGAQGGTASQPVAAQTIHPRPVAYDIQPYYGGGYHPQGEVIEAEWRQVSGRELSAPRGMPSPSSDD